MIKDAEKAVEWRDEFCHNGRRDDNTAEDRMPMNIYTFRPHTRHFIDNVVSGNFAEAEQLLAKHDYIPTDRNSSGETALHWLAIENEPEGVRMLLKHGADPNTEELSGNSALADAASLGDSGMVRILLEAGADIHRRHPHNQETALHTAARHTSDVETLALLLDAGADIHARDHLGWSPLHSAAIGDNLKAAEFLLDNGADPTAGDMDGSTFVYWAPDENRPAWESLRDAVLKKRCTDS